MNRPLSLLLLISLLAVSSAFPAAEEETPLSRFDPATRFPADTAIYLDIPSLALLFERAATTGPGRFIASLEGEELLAPGAGFGNYAAFARKVRECKPWGLAVGWSRAHGLMLMARGESVTPTQILDCFFALDGALKDSLAPVPGKDGQFAVAEYLVSTEGGELIICREQVLLDMLREPGENRLDAVLKGRSARPEDGGYRLFLDNEKAALASYFDAGLEENFARLLGLRSLGTLTIDGAISGGWFRNRINLSPTSTGWTGLPAALAQEGTAPVTGRFAHGALVSSALKLDPAKLLPLVAETLSPESRKRLDEAMAVIAQNAKATPADVFAGAFNGDMELHLFLPGADLVPNFLLRLGSADAKAAETLFDYLNQDLLRIFPSSTTVEGRKVWFSPAMKGIGLAPAASFVEEGLLVSGTTMNLRRAIATAAVEFPAQGSQAAERWDNMKGAQVLMLGDGAEFARWLTGSLPTIQLLTGVSIVRPEALPLPEEAAEFFGTTSFYMVKGTDGRLSGEWVSDLDLMIFLVASWFGGAAAGAW